MEMRKLFITLVATGLAATAMARFDVYNYKVGGYMLQLRPDKGVEIINGEKSRMDGVAKRTGSMWGYIIHDELGGAGPTFLYINKGEYAQGTANLTPFFEIDNKYVEMSNGSTHTAAVGLANYAVNVSLDGTSFTTIFIGKYSEVIEDGDYLKYQLSAKGSGFGIDGSGDLTGLSGQRIVVKDARLKYNQKLSDLMWKAFVAAGGETNEAAGVAAAVDVINKLINRAAHIDNADFDLYWND